MKYILILFIISLGACAINAQVSEPLYPIRNGTIFGYIDKTGKTIIKPQFLSAGSFSEGLAAARLNGSYGYIDQSGQFAINPRFDLAYAFHNGIAKVFIDGKPAFIHRDGKIIFEHEYKSISSFENNRAIVETETEKFGLIDTAGKLRVDTIYSAMMGGTNGLFIVHNPQI